MKYNPDRWKILEIVSPEGETFHKVFGTWGGGYISADRWRMNSGIKKVTRDGDHFQIHGHSGSMYLCAAYAEGVTGYGATVLATLLDNPAVTVVDDGVKFLEEAADEHEE